MFSVSAFLQQNQGPMIIVAVVVVLASFQAKLLWKQIKKPWPTGVDDLVNRNRKN